MADRRSPVASTGTLYDQAFAALDGKSAQIPIYWDSIMHLADGLNNAVVALVPCSPDLRTYAYRLDNVRIKEPILRRQLELFTRDCWLKARAKFMANHTKLPANYPPEDIDWIGSQYFLDTDGFYGNANLNLSMRASEEIPGFPYNAARDTEYQAGFIPTYGRPECKDWWEDSLFGLQPQLLALVDPEAITQTNIDLRGDVQGAYNAVIRRIVEPEKTAFSRLINIDNYGNPYGASANPLTKGVASLGVDKELLFWFPKIYALTTGRPHRPVLYLNGYLYVPALYPAVLGVFHSGTVYHYRRHYWHQVPDPDLDPGRVDRQSHDGRVRVNWFAFTFDDDQATSMSILNMVAMLMFVVLPVVWFMVIGWAG